MICITNHLISNIKITPLSGPLLGSLTGGLIVEFYCISYWYLLELPYRGIFLTSAHTMWFCGEIRKIIPQLSSFFLFLNLANILRSCKIKLPFLIVKLLAIHRMSCALCQFGLRKANTSYRGCSPVDLPTFPFNHIWSL